MLYAASMPTLPESFDSGKSNLIVQSALLINYVPINIETAPRLVL